MALHSGVTGKIQAFKDIRDTAAAGLTNKSVLELCKGKIALNKGNLMDHQMVLMLKTARFDGRSICCNSLVLLSKSQCDVL